MESLKISLINLSNGLTNSNSHIQYQGYVQNIGWQNPVQDGTIAGTIGNNLRLEALKINLTGNISKYFSISYRAHVENIGWEPFVTDGIISGTVGKGLRIEAIEIQITLK
ncbi:Ig domain-containing protein [Lactococcus lactis]|uniref:Ig domain-containing protein n=1 Tax=Lactococcus lactis TaxID=1358 RepID=UPI000345548F|nr:Ig domain-containing protein [Lactococcus lactis]KST97753.1 N-acetylmuramoyl-L-alanine amidase [Lactococcus lactis subsp. lactis]MDU0397541.1 hypothetical protein [Lactococcus lactis]